MLQYIHHTTSNVTVTITTTTVAVIVVIVQRKRSEAKKKKVSNFILSIRYDFYLLNLHHITGNPITTIVAC